MAFAIKPPLPPMEVRLVEEIPAGEAWQYEPKRDSGEPRSETRKYSPRDLHRL
jgi:hypothetical protein